MKQIYTMLLIFSFFAGKAIKVYSQTPLEYNRSSMISENRVVSMPAGIQFAASGWKQFWWGKHWRKEWLTPVGFPVFDIDSIAGGLIPLKEGGGHQTKSLRLLGKNGKEYVLRTIDKDLDILIPAEFKGSFIDDIVNDQISIAHPYAPLVIAELSSAVGILHTNPVIVFVPDEPKLAEFRTDFANRLCLFEERPSGAGWENTSLTNYADDVINSEKLFTKLLADNERNVDQKEFLKARLLDMLINDWDRHTDQWVWAAHKSKHKTTYVPFARDRDQGFTKTDGISLYFLSRPWMLRSLRSLDANIRDVIGVNLAAVGLDKVFMNELSKEQWINTIRSLQNSLTDSVIQIALKKMPADIYNLSGKFLMKRLAQRRDNMQRYASRYYNILNKKITITGTDNEELFTINKIDKDSTEIIIQQAGNNKQSMDTLFHRVFTSDITKEINIYGLGKNDRFVYSGYAKNKITLRTIGGDGEDKFIDSTIIKGYGKKSFIYDSQNNTIGLTRPYKVNNAADTSYTNYNRKSFKYDWWKPIILAGYNPDDGLIVNVGFTYKKQSWHKYPFAWQQTFNISVATGTRSFGFSYLGIFKQALGKWDIKLNADFKAPEYVLNFYGYGNDSKLNGSKNSYFRVRSTGLFLNPALSHNYRGTIVDAGVIFQTVKIQATENKFITQPNNLIDPLVFTSQYYAGANLSFGKRSLINPKNPQFGLGYQVAASYLINLKNAGQDFLNLKANIYGFLPITKNLTLAHRTGFATNFGEHEFYQANTIGGKENLRGYWRTRFAGRTSFYQNTELRMKLVDLKGYVFRGTLGIYGFFDDGKVWVKGENSNVLHTGFGGGIYFVPYNKIALNVSYSSSKEVNIFTISTGFLF